APGARVPPDATPEDYRPRAGAALRLRLERGGTLAGRIVDADGRPLAGAVIFAEGVRSGAAFSDAAGRFAFTGVFVDKVDLRLRSQTLRAELHDVPRDTTGLLLRATRR